MTSCGFCPNNQKAECPELFHIYFYYDPGKRTHRIPVLNISTSHLGRMTSLNQGHKWHREQVEK